MQNPHLRNAMLLVLLAAVIISAILPDSFVAVMATSLAIMATFGILDLLKRA